MNNYPQKNKKSIFSKLSGFGLATIILMLVFFIVGATTMGVFNSVGKSAHLYSDSQIVFFLDFEEKSQSELAKVYFNFGSIYTEQGSNATVTMQYSSGSGSSVSWSSGSKLGAKKVANLYSGDDETLSANNYNWNGELFDMSSNTLSSSYRLIKLTVSDEMLINEVVFVDKNDKVIPAYAAYSTKLDEKLAKKYSDESVYLRVKQLIKSNPNDAKNVLDSQNKFKLGESYRYNFTENEIYSLIQIDNIFLGKGAESDSVYSGDTDFGSLATLILSFGTLIFGKSTFGLRFMPLVATTLLLGLIYLFAKKLFKSDGFAFMAAVLFAIGGFAFTVGRIGMALSALALLILGCYYLMYRFYENGINEQTPIRSVLNVFFSGLCFAGAFSIWAHSWIIAIGAAVIFIIKIVKMFIEKKQAITEAENLEEEISTYPIAADYNYSIKISIAMFIASFVFATFVIAVLTALPSYLSYVRMYDDVANPKLGLFALVGKMLENTTNISNFTSFNAANACNAFSWFIGLKGATLFSTSEGASYLALNVQNNILMTLTSLVGFIFSTVYVIVYFIAGGKDNPEYKKSFKVIGNTYLVLTLGTILSALASAVIPMTSMIYSMTFFVFYTAYIPLFGYICYSHDKSEKTLFFNKFALNKTLKVIIIVIAVCLLLFVASLPMTFGFKIPTGVEKVLFGWTSILNNGFFR